MPRRTPFPFLFVLLVLAACSTRVTPTASPGPQQATTSVTQTTPVNASRPIEAAVTIIPLTEPAARAQSEFSGMAWYGETLILLPQYPARFDGGSEGALLALPRQVILDYLDGKNTSPLSPQPVPLAAAGLKDAVGGFEGFEAIAFEGDTVYLTIEARGLTGMRGYLLRGSIAPDLSGIVLDVTSLVEIQPQASLDNLSDEALLVTPERIFTFYEANGANVNPKAQVHQFDAELQPLPGLPLENMEYRLTDAAGLDEAGRFWVINYLFPDDAKKLKPALDALAKTYGQGASHAASAAVERLVQMELTPQGIRMADTPPVQLELLPDDEARNWEGLALLPGRGFLLVTDKFPTTLFGFVAYAGVK